MPWGQQAMRRLWASGNGHAQILQMSADLVPREVAEKWLTYLRAELPTVAFKCSTQKQVGSFCHNSQRAAPHVGLEGGGAP